MVQTPPRGAPIGSPATCSLINALIHRATSVATGLVILTLLTASASATEPYEPDTPRAFRNERPPRPEGQDRPRDGMRPPSDAPPGPSPDEGPPGRRRGLPGLPPAPPQINRMTDADDDGTTLPYNMRVALTEVQTLPTLEPHIQRMAELYQQRVRLEAARRSKAQQRLPRPEGSTGPMDWRRHYHNLLADEDRIGQQMESTIEAIRAQSGQILDEITRRREHIARRIDEIEARLEELQPEETDSLAGPPQDHEDRTALLGELRTLRRAERLHITLQDRVTRLREGRGNPLPMRRMVRGGLQEFLGIGSWGGRESSTGGGFDRRPGRAEGPPGPMPPQAFPFDGPGRTPRNPQFRRRINQIETEAAALKRRLKELDQERQDLIGGDSPAPAESRPSPGPGPGPNT